MIVGIIDSGVDRAYIQDGTVLLSDTRFVYKYADARVSVCSEYRVSDLHGTMVLNTVEKYKGTAENQYIVCNVYDESGVAHVEAVLEALRFLRSTDVELIVISLTVNPRYAASFCEELQKLSEKGVKIFVSFSNEGKESGLLDNKYVYGVDRLPAQAAKKWQFKKINGNLLADARPELIPMGNDRFSVFHGTSKANAMAAGFFSEAKKLKSRRKPKTLTEKIKYQAADVSRSKINAVYCEILESISDANEIEYAELSGETELSEIVPNVEDIAPLLQHIAEKHHLCVDYASLPVEMFENLAGVECFIEYHEKKVAGERVDSLGYRVKSFIHKYRLHTVVKECVRYLKYNVAQIIVSLVCSGAVFLTPLIEQRIVDSGIESRSMKALCIWAGALVLNAVLQKILDAGNSLVSVKVGNKIEMDLRGRLVEKITSVKIDGFAMNDSGKLDTLIKSDFSEFNSIVTTSVLTIVVSLFELVFATVMMLRYNLLLGSVIFILQIISLFIISGQFDKLEKNTTILRESFITQNRILNDIIINIRWIRLIGAKDYLLNQFRIAMRNKSSQLEHATLLNLKVSSFDEVISSVGTAIMYLIGGYLIINGNLTMGMLIGFMQYAGKFASPVSGLISEVTSYRSNIAAISDICDYLEETGARFTSRVEKTSLAQVDSIEVCNLSFGYEDNNPIFHEANGTFSKQYINYIVGPSGAGKSTLAQLIIGGYLPQSGKLLINGVDIREMDNIESLIAYVPQRPIILNDSIYNNLTLGESVDKGDLIRICRACCIHDEILNLPMGYETQMGEAGTCFSGGELQRIALARALLRKEPILLLDECTSALDVATEIHIRDQIKEELEKRLSIIITHSEHFVLPQKSRVFLISDGKISLDQQNETETTFNDLE